MPSKVSHYDRLKIIGEGTYGAVYKARDIETSEWVALKRMFIEEEDDEGIASTTIREIALLKQLNHPNVIRLQKIFFERNDLYLVFDLLSCDLKAFMKREMLKHKMIAINKIQNIMYQILDGISYCHSVGIIHRDIKPQNILINCNTEGIKITDFGLSRCYNLPNKTWTHEIITLWYRPPEVLLGCKSYSIYVDIWSIGCLFAELLNHNKPLFHGNSEISQLMQIFMKCGTPNDSPYFRQHCKDFKSNDNYKVYPKWERKNIQQICPRKWEKKYKHLKGDGLQLLDKMLYLEPNTRITPKEALQHQFFTNYKHKIL